MNPLRSLKHPAVGGGDVRPWSGMLATAVLVVASLVPEIRLATLVVLVAALIFAGRNAALRWSIAAVIPAAVYLASGTLPQPSTTGIGWCGELLSPPVVRTVGGALAVFVVVGLLAWRLPSSRAQIGLVRPSRKLILWSAAVALVVALGSLALGAILAGPFFGRVELKLDDLWAIAPALVFAAASASMQEVAYRGAMLGWLTPSMGGGAALVAQAIAFGASHTGPDFVASPLPVLLVVAIGGAIAGYIVQRQRSLAFVIAVHAAFDIPLYYVAACRLT